METPPRFFPPHVLNRRHTHVAVTANGDWLNPTQAVTRPEPVGEGHHDVERGQEEDEVEEEVAVGHALALVVDHLLAALVLVVNHHLFLCARTTSHRNQTRDKRIQTIIILIKDGGVQAPSRPATNRKEPPYWLGFIGWKTSLFLFYEVVPPLLNRVVV